MAGFDLVQPALGSGGGLEAVRVSRAGEDGDGESDREAHFVEWVQKELFFW